MLPSSRAHTNKRLFNSRDLLEELRRFNSLSGARKGGDGADRILPPILRTLQLLLAPAPNVKAGKLRLLDGGVAGLEEEPGSETASEVDDLRKVIWQR